MTKRLFGMTSRSIGAIPAISQTTTIIQKVSSGLAVMSVETMRGASQRNTKRIST
jgi:hypothetical protein